MSPTPHSALGHGATHTDRTPCHSPEICEVTGERFFLAGEYVSPGEYVEVTTARRVILTFPDFLPARCDGQVGCYRVAPRAWGAPVERTLAQRQAQFQRLTAPMHPRLYSYARRNLGNSQDAEDATQETFARAWAHFEDFDLRRPFEAWVFRIARNLIYDMLRRRKYRSELSLDSTGSGFDGLEGVCHPELSDSANDPHACLMDKELSAELEGAIRSLSPVYRTPLLLAAEQRTYQEIADDLGCPVGTIRSRLSRARRMLRHTLEESAPHLSKGAR